MEPSDVEYSQFGYESSTNVTGTEMNSLHGGNVWLVLKAEKGLHEAVYWKSGETKQIGRLLDLEMI